MQLNLMFYTYFLFFAASLNENIFEIIEYIYRIILPVLRDEGKITVGLEQFQPYY